MRFSVVTVLSVLALPALAAEPRVVDAPVVEVVLHPSGARIVRAAEADFDRGLQRVQLRGLPEKLDPAALELLASPPANAAVAGVDFRTRTTATPVHERERRLREEIEALERQRDLHRDRIRAGEVQLRLLRRLAALAGEDAGRELFEGKPDPRGWRRGWETVGTGALEILTNIRDSRYAAEEMERRIEAKRRELEEIETGARAEGVLDLELEVFEPGRLALAVVHEHPDAGFRPVYEAELAGAEGTVELRRRAVLHQRTGEDWKGVSVTLANLRTRGRTAPPEPQPWFVDVREPRPLPRGLETRRTAPPAPMTAAVVPETTPFAVRYRLRRPVDLPADGRERIVSLDTTRHRARVLVTAFPAEDPDPYVVARFRWDGDAPLLPGELRLFRDGVFAGRDRLPPTAPGTDLRLGFGRDDAVEVERRLDTGFRSEEGIFESSRRVERHFVTRIRNGHDRPVEIELLDRLPVPQDERIEVELTSETTPPSEWDVGGRRGVLAWRDTFAPGEEREIRFGFAVIFPKDLEVDGFGGGG